ncbi:MAG TPA: SDR family NAD(P)-dependent oxidoreductase [Bacteroidales bacterium]|nr:SDR family NAD(P)-dependent oxidoreductase [Bacteroidales bacterium]
MGNTKKIVMITGATSGIGLACAEIFAMHGYHLIITGRRKERLHKISSSFPEKYKVSVLPLNFDIRNKNETEKALSQLPEKWKNIDILINNAGLARGFNLIQDGDTQDWDEMIDTNLKGLLYVSKFVIPLMIARQKGHIINVGSIAGKEPYINGNVYCATKAAVDSLTRSMRIDLLKHNIKVTQIAPGATETEFSLVRYRGNKDAARKTYEGFKPLKGKDIASIILYAASLPPHVNINDMIITPTAQANTVHTARKQQK